MSAEEYKKRKNWNDNPVLARAIQTYANSRRDKNQWTKSSVANHFNISLSVFCRHLDKMLLLNPVIAPSEHNMAVVLNVEIIPICSLH
jgi:hypothetical protein